ncbi:MAG: Gfo/Idh/MocA family oxidoreductase [Clostridia bacterium]|nr:Gfo/Idh/MocA family oxidoreductase [Clostridia bacterium]
MKKIGFIDYYISEWHANNYPKWIGEACEALGADYKVAYAWAELDVSPKYGETTAEWCEKFGAEKCDTIEELCEKSDVIVILAPSDPEKHLGYAEKVLKYGKRTYIDKTFAPTYAEAKKIFNIAKKYNTPFFSSSALRYGEELATEFDCREAIITGSGSNLPEYIVHQTEMVVKKLGLGATQVKTEQYGAQTYVHVAYDDDRQATIIFAPSMPYTAYMYGGEGTKPVYKAVKSAFFVNLITDMVRFFEDGTVSFDTNETLEVMKIREGAIRALETAGEWLDLSELEK